MATLRVTFDIATFEQYDKNYLEEVREDLEKAIQKCLLEIEEPTHEDFEMGNFSVQWIEKK